MTEPERSAERDAAIDALLDARLEFAARQSTADEAVVRELWLESYPRTEPPAWPVGQTSEVSA